jgi:phosphoglycerate dehydrogenase-like enzyme
MRIAILDDYQNVSQQFADWSGLAADHEITVFNAPLRDRLSQLQPFDIICAMRERTLFDRELIEQLPNLKLIVTTGMRNASIDSAACAERGITVSGTESHGQSAGELTFALLMALARVLPQEIASLRAGNWQQSIGRALYGATLGIIGLGRIGAQMASFAKPFGMNVLAWSQNLTEERCAEAGVDYASRADLLARSDFVTIHLKLSERTTGFFGADDFDAMKSDAYLINTSRGPIVDQDALIDAVTNGKIAGAALDVFDEEPLPADHPLLDAPNLLLTPHIGYVTRETYDLFYTQTVEAIEAFLDGNPVRVIS